MAQAVYHRQYLILMSKYIVSLFLFCAISFISYSQSLDVLQSNKDALLKEIKLIEQSIDNTSQSREKNLENLNLINQEIILRNKIILKLRQELSDIDYSISQRELEINKLDKEIHQIKEEYSKLLLDAYKRKFFYSDLVFFLSSNSFTEGYQKFRLLKEYSNYRKLQGQKIILKQQQVSALMKSIISKKEEKEENLNSIEVELKKLNQSYRDQDKLVASLEQERDWLISELNKKHEQSKQLERQILALIEISKSSTIGTNFESFKGKLRWPIVNGFVVNTFGEHSHSVLKNVSIKNNGIDIQVSNDKNVYSVFNGEVSRIVGIPGFNTTVIVRHGKYLTVYANLSESNVKQGDTVIAGDIVGKVFSEKVNINGALHFEVWLQNQKLNPLEWLIRQN